MLSAERLIAAAAAKTGLEDFGGDEFREPLQRLVEALNTEAKLSETGATLAGKSIASALGNRLLIQDYITRHPDVRDESVARPVFIAGLPRSGTTALHHMLNADRANRTLRLWEGRKPVPPPTAKNYLTDPRIEQARRAVAMTEKFMPGFLKAHLLDAEAPDECHLLFGRNFMSAEYTASYHVPGFARWLYAQDLSESYAYHRLQLQLLQSNKTGVWILKSPFHQLGLQAILTTYPDAIIVNTHRSPTTAVASGCSFVSIVRRAGSDNVDLRDIGHDWLGMLEVYTTNFEKARRQLEPRHPDQFIDIYHDDFVRDPWRELDKIYRAGGREIRPDARRAMQHWLDENPKGKHGKHEYRLADYGLNEADVQRVFGDYAARYDLTL